MQNIYGSPAIRNANVCNMTNSDDIVSGKKSLRTIVEFENDALRRIGGKGKVNFLNIRIHIFICFFIYLNLNSYMNCFILFYISNISLQFIITNK